MQKKNLHNIKKTGFTTPNNYFEGIEDSILNQIKLQEKVGDTGFKTPDNYFEGLENSILEKVKPEPKVISIFTKRNLFYAASIAAIFLLMLGTFLNNTKLTFDDLESTTIVDYLFVEDIDTYEIAAFLTDEELNSEHFIESELTGDILEDYLLENATIEDLIIE